MQFHLDGLRTGDPDLHPAAPGVDPDTWPDIVDVLIVGTGPAGLLLAAQLARFPSITTRIVERRAGPLEMGQADGVACRTVEMFHAFGLSAPLLRESYWVNETVFWGPDPAAPTGIIRTGRVQDVEDGLSEFPHVIVNQARMQHYLLDRMAKSPTRLRPAYDAAVIGLTVPDSATSPVEVRIRDSAGNEHTVRARYVVGADGTRSAVRRAIGIELHGDAQNHAWGVVDALAVTDFPDIRLKAVIQSAAGNILLIPREGGYLVRLYVDLGEISADDPQLRTRITDQHIVDAASRALAPYSLDVRDIGWWSVYEVGQRLADRFDDRSEGREPRVFIAGDACHTHSAKAGQGMNVSMQDAFNLGWKLAAVLTGRSPESLLRSYSDERQPIAQELIDFDRGFEKAIGRRADDDAGRETGATERQFLAAGRFTAGVATRYSPSLLTSDGSHQDLAAGFTIGMRFHSAPVIRLADARPMHLGHVHEADGRWRLYLFADRAGPSDAGSAIRRTCDFLASDEASPVRRFTPDGADIDSVVDVRGIYQQPHREIDLGALPPLLLPPKGRLGLRDYEKAFAPDPADDIFDTRGVSRDGCAVVVRPDQYVAHVLPLDAHGELTDFFSGFLLEG